MHETALDFRDEWSHTRVDVVSPNEQVFITLIGDTDLRVSFAPGYVERATRPQLEEQVARTARLVFARRTEAFYELRSREAGHLLRPGRHPANDRAARFRAARDELVVEGASPDGSVRIVSVGLRDFSVRITPPPGLALDATWLAGAVAAAGTALVADQARGVAELRREVYFSDA